MSIILFLACAGQGWIGSMDDILVWAWMLANGWVGSMDVIMVWAWMHWPVDAVVAGSMNAIVVCTGHWMCWQHRRDHSLGMDALANGRVGSMDAITARAWSSIDAIMVWACRVGSMDAFMYWIGWQHGRYHRLALMHWPLHGMVAWTSSWFGHGCTGQPTL